MIRKWLKAADAGKGTQKITVEQVHVHSGGEAVVGIVETAGEGLMRWVPRASFWISVGTLLSLCISIAW